MNCSLVLRRRSSRSNRTNGGDHEIHDGGESEEVHDGEEDDEADQGEEEGTDELSIRHR